MISFYFKVIVCCVRNSVLLMCVITALNVEVLHTEHRDFQMVFCQMGSDDKSRKGFLPLRRY